MIILFFIFVLLAGPLAIGLGALLVSGRRKQRFPVPALLIHSVHEKSRANCSYIRTTTLRTLLHALKERRYRALTLGEFGALSPEQLKHHDKTIMLTFDDGYENFYSNALPFLQEFEMKATFFPIAGLLGRQTVGDVFPPQKHASETQLREIISCGNEIGSHTVTHPDLRFLDDKDLDRELRESKEILEQACASRVTSLSFPFGGWNLRVWNHAKQAGYLFGAASRCPNKPPSGIIPTLGVYSFDTVDAIFSKFSFDSPFSITRAYTHIMPHFAKGTPIWLFRKEYSALRLLHSFRNG